MHCHPLSATVSALADPTRRAILARLAPSPLRDVAGFRRNRRSAGQLGTPHRTRMDEPNADTARVVAPAK